MEITIVPTDSLTPYANNARIHSDRQIKQIAASIQEFGFTNPILTHNGTVIAGHGRLQAAQLLELSEVPTIARDDLSEAQWKAYAVADNRLAEMAEWDTEILALEIVELQDLDFDLEPFGIDDVFFEEVSIGAFDGKPSEGLTDPDDVPEPPTEPITKTGDLWLLGDHRLLCGDSTDAESVALLMGGAKADICFTSPPYALGRSVSLSGNKTMSKHKNAYNQYIDTPENWEELMSGWWDASQSAVCAVWVVNLQLLAGNKQSMVKWINERSERLIDVAVWNKQRSQPAMAKSVMNSEYEWLVIMGVSNSTRSIPFSSWRGTVSNVYTAPPNTSNESSKTLAAAMPFHLPIWVMGTICDQSKSVYEPFAGTGTTFIAAEQLVRKCYGLEIDPTYCDVIVARWEAFTGKKATLAEAVK